MWYTREGEKKPAGHDESKSLFSVTEKIKKKLNGTRFEFLTTTIYARAGLYTHTHTYIYR